MAKRKHSEVIANDGLIENKEKDRYVNMALALLLKKYGYHEPCRTKMSTSTGILSLSLTKCDWNNSRRFISAPRLEDVSSWLSENFELTIQLFWLKSDNEDGYYTWFIYDTRKDTQDDDATLLEGGVRWDTKYEALDDALSSLFEEFGESLELALSENEYKQFNEEQGFDIDMSCMPKKRYSKVEILT